MAWARSCEGLPPRPLVGVLPHAHTCPQLFITVMDKLRLEIRAMDEVQLMGGWGETGRAGRQWSGAHRARVCRSSPTCGS